jgi:hypothetical protein
VRKVAEYFLVSIVVFLFLSGCASHKQVSNHPLSVQIPPIAPQRCSSRGGLPDPNCTPGAVRTTDLASICNGGSTKQYRPSSSYTNKLKKQQMVEYGYVDTNLSDYEEDHLISLELGGDGSDPKNLWPEPHTGPFNSFDKDKVENWLHKQICTNAISVNDAQKGIAENWKQYVPAASRGTPQAHNEVR